MEQTIAVTGLRKRFRRNRGLDAPDAGEALVSFRIATAVRDAAISVAIVLGLLYLFPLLGPSVSSPGWYRQLRQIATMTAGPEISVGLKSLPISPWAGLGVLAAWAAAALLAGVLLLRFRDA
ncbi:MAG: hypothetical protein ABSA02_11030 [Trebonia sp.]|jgi:ABC-2 type transport system permease protein